MNTTIKPVFVAGDLYKAVSWIYEARVSGPENGK